jgi:hypothetical protein
MQIKRLSRVRRAAKRKYDKARYARIKVKRRRQMRAYKLQHRKRLNSLEAARRRRLRPQLRAAARARYWANPAYFKAAMIKYRYKGASRPTRPKPRKCEACPRREESRRLHVDHDHKRKRFRGWLCSNCNTGIGLLGDNIVGLKRALRYLEKHDRRNRSKRCTRQ